MGCYQLLHRDLEYAIKALHILAVAARPVLLPELAEFIAMEIENRQVDVDAQFQDASEILIICSNLITSTRSSWRSIAGVVESACEDALPPYRRSKSYQWREEDSVEEVRLAQLSVKEWLTSLSYYNIVSARVGPLQTAPDLVAQTCLAYPLQFATPRDFIRMSVAEFPLLNYAVYDWLHHLEICLSQNGSPTIRQITRGLLRSNRVQFLNVAFVFYCKYEYMSSRTDRWPTNHACPGEIFDANAISSNERIEFGSPIYLTASFGASQVCQLLIIEGADVNAFGGIFETPIQQWHCSLIGSQMSTKLEFLIQRTLCSCLQWPQ
jgi:hypothetical protein